MSKDREAVEVLKMIRFITSFSPDDFVLVQKIANLLYELGEGEIALNIYKNLLEERDLDKQLKIALFQGGARIAVAQNEPVIASRWNLEARKLKSPPTPRPTNKK